MVRTKTRCCNIANSIPPSRVRRRSGAPAIEVHPCPCAGSSKKHACRCGTRLVDHDMPGWVPRLDLSTVGTERPSTDPFDAWIQHPSKVEVLGTDAQVLNVTLAPNEFLQSVPGAINFREPSVQMSSNCDGGAARWFSGSSCIMSQYSYIGATTSTIGLSPLYPARIINLSFTRGQPRMITSAGAYFASLGDISIGCKLDCKNLLLGCCGGPCCYHQTVQGNGNAFLVTTRLFTHEDLREGETIIVHPGNVIAWSETLTLGVQVRDRSSACCCRDDDRLFDMTLSGPGRAVLHFKSARDFSKRIKRRQANFAGKANQRGGGPPKPEMMER